MPPCIFNPIFARSLNPGAAAGVLLSVLFFSLGASADVAVTVGPDWSLVRETRVMPLTRGDQQVALENIPVEADAASLVVHARRLPIELLAIERTLPAPAPAPPLRHLPAMDEVVWNPSPFFLGAPEDSRPAPMRAWIRSPLATSHRIDLVYALHGLRWGVSYVLGFRPSEGDPHALTADFSGLVSIHNSTSASFSNALVRLIGEERPRNVPGPLHARAGFLMLDDQSPLSDLWLRRDREVSPLRNYGLKEKADIAPNSRSQISLVRSDRVRAQRRFRMRALGQSDGATESLLPFEEVIFFENSLANRLGMDLPAGPVTLEDRRQGRSYLVQGWMDHSSDGDVIGIALGPADEVRGRRRILSRESVAPGVFEETYELQVENRSRNPISTLIEEVPPVGQQWRVVRATTPLAISQGRITLSPEVPPRSELRIQYRLRFGQPER